MAFFFQAEDGIRDYKVTGVQTCALPISDEAKRAGIALTQTRVGSMLTSFFTQEPVVDWNSAKKSDTKRYGLFRSEERRVGKERRDGILQGLINKKLVWT